jgi:hypothetical protein
MEVVRLSDSFRCLCSTNRIKLATSHVARLTLPLGDIFGTKREEVTGNWRKILSEELLNLHVHQILLRW